MPHKPAPESILDTLAPVLSKAADDPRRDYKPMTWDRFLLLRAWAKWIAWREQCTVALVGSALEKTVPRDIDIALIWPATKFEEMFGTVFWHKYGEKGLYERQAYEDKRVSLFISAKVLVKSDTRIDVRLCPDCWWPEKDRLILAEPCEVEPPNRWGDVEFVVYEVARPGEKEAEAP